MSETILFFVFILFFSILLIMHSFYQETQTLLINGSVDISEMKFFGPVI